MKYIKIDKPFAQAAAVFGGLTFIASTFFMPDPKKPLNMDRYESISNKLYSYNIEEAISNPIVYRNASELRAEKTELEKQGIKKEIANYEFECIANTVRQSLFAVTGMLLTIPVSSDLIYQYQRKRRKPKEHETVTT